MNVRCIAIDPGPGQAPLVKQNGTTEVTKHYSKLQPTQSPEQRGLTNQKPEPGSVLELCNSLMRKDYSAPTAVVLQRRERSDDRSQLTAMAVASL